MNTRIQDSLKIKKSKTEFSDAFHCCSNLLETNGYCEGKNEKISLKSATLGQQMYKSMIDIWNETLKNDDKTTEKQDKKKPSSVTSTVTCQTKTEESKQTNKSKNYKRKMCESESDTDDDYDEDYKPPRTKKKQVGFDDKVRVVKLSRQHPEWSLTKLRYKSGCSKLSSRHQLSSWMRQVDIGGSKDDMVHRINEWVFEKFIENQKNNINVTNDLLKKWVYCAKEICFPKSTCAVEATPCWLFKFKKEYGVVGNSNDLFIDETIISKSKTGEKKKDVKKESLNYQQCDKKAKKNKTEPLLVDLDDDDEQNEKKEEKKKEEDQQMENNIKKEPMSVSSDENSSVRKEKLNEPSNGEAKKNKNEPLLINLDSESSDEEIQINKAKELTVKERLTEDDEKKDKNKTASVIVTLEVNQSNVNDKLIENRAKTTKPAAIILKKGDEKKKHTTYEKIDQWVFKKCCQLTLRNEKFSDEFIKDWAVEAANLYCLEARPLHWKPSDNWLMKFKQRRSIIGQSPNLVIKESYVYFLKSRQESKAPYLANSHEDIVNKNIDNLRERDNDKSNLKRKSPVHSSFSNFEIKKELL